MTHDLSQTQFRVVSRPDGAAAAAAATDASVATVSAADATGAAAGSAAGSAASTGAPLAPIFGGAAKQAGAAKPKVQKDVAKKPRRARAAKAARPAASAAGGGGLAPIFGKARKKRAASPELPKVEPSAPLPPAAQKDAGGAEATAPATVPDMFLTKKQKRERSEAESLRRLREEQERNRRDDEELSKGKAVHPYLHRRVVVPQQSKADGSSRGDSQPAASAVPPWLAPGGAIHVAQRTQRQGQPSAAIGIPNAPAASTPSLQADPSRMPLLDKEWQTAGADAAAAVPPARQILSYRRVDEASIEQFATSPAVVGLLCGESAEYAGLKRSHKVLINTFQRCLRYRFGAESKRSATHDLWCSIYRPEYARDVCGNREHVTRLSTWLQHKKQSMIAAKAKPKSRARKYYSDSDDDFTDSYTNAAGLKDPSELWETSSEYNVVLLTGPPGSGKSAAIHAVSSECKYTVIEMNSSERRSGKAVQDKCGEATQSHGLQKWQASNSSEGSRDRADPAPPKQRKGKGKGGKGKGKGKGKAGKSKLTLDKNASASLAASGMPAAAEAAPEVSLIVFEEIDVLFEDDRGFFKELCALEESTKRPIILTSTSESVDGLPENLPMLRANFEAPSVAEIRDLVRCICLCEGVVLEAADATAIIEKFNSDMRAILMDLQMRFQGEGIENCAHLSCLQRWQGSHVSVPCLQLVCWFLSKTLLSLLPNGLGRADTVSPDTSCAFAARSSPSRFGRQACRHERAGGCRTR
eukprot:COSAG04_NODE_2106_length_4770_cov_6.166774_2_plen_754_part_00